MIKYLALITMLATPISAAALTAEQELSQKCELRLANRAKNISGKSIYKDKRVCGCIVTEIKKQATGSKLQDIADFYTEKYETAPYKGNPKDISVPRLSSQCLARFYKKEEIRAENEKIVAANKEFTEKRKKEMEARRAEREKKAKAKPAQKKPAKTAPATKKSGPYTPIPAKNKTTKD